MAAAAPEPFIPNDIFRHIRTVYIGCIMVAMPLLFFALLAATNGIGGGILPILLVVGGVGLIVVGMIARASARCPKCNTSLMWKSAPMGMGRVSLAVKPKCPSCGLDLDQPWQLPASEAGPSSSPQMDRS